MMCDCDILIKAGCVVRNYSRLLCWLHLRLPLGICELKQSPSGLYHSGPFLDVLVPMVARVLQVLYQGLSLLFVEHLTSQDAHINSNFAGESSDLQRSPHRCKEL